MKSLYYLTSAFLLVHVNFTNTRNIEYNCTQSTNDELITQDLNCLPKSCFSDPKRTVHDYVDLGLPSGTLWATCNIGAENPEERGLYFAWGETEGYSRDKTESHEFSWMYYKWADGIGYNFVNKYTCEDGLTYCDWYKNGIYVGTVVNGKEYKNLRELLPEDDAATVCWGEDWCIPSSEQICELFDSRYTTTKWMKRNGVWGLRVKSRKKKSCIFLPVTGYCLHYQQYVDSGFYLSRTLCPDHSSSAFHLCFTSNQIYPQNGGPRYAGCCIRPVRK